MRLYGILILSFVTIAKADTIPEGVQNIALTVNTLSNLADGSKKNQGFGISKSAKLSEISAVTPIQVYTFDYNQLRNGSNGNSVSSIINPINSWKIPLTEKGQIVSFLDVYNDKSGCWQTVGGGASPIAKSWGVILKVWPKSSGYNPIFIETGGRGLYFFVPEKGDSNLTWIKPIDDGVEGAINYKDAFALYSKLTPSKEIIKSLTK